MKAKYILSMIAGLISVGVVGYSLLAPIWGWIQSDKIISTGTVVVLILSGILTVFTGQKISQEYTPNGVLIKMNENKLNNNDLTIDDLDFPESSDDLTLDDLDFTEDSDDLDLEAQYQKNIEEGFFHIEDDPEFDMPDDPTRILNAPQRKPKGRYSK